MAEIVNLRAARKARDRKAKQAVSTENAVKFGRPKAEKRRDAAQAEKARRDLDGHARD